MQEDYRKEIQEAIDAADRALVCLQDAKRALNSARNWGIFDMFEGEFITTWIKHSRMNKAEDCMEAARTALMEFADELDDVDQMIDFNYNRTDFFTFADFFMDGLLSDFIMQGRINEARRNVDETISRVERIRKAETGAIREPLENEE